jgi:hypothetical protein
MPPIYRDVHPDMVPVELYGEKGRIVMRADMDARIIEAMDAIAAREKVDFQGLMIAALARQLGLLEGPFGLNDG